MHLNWLAKFKFRGPGLLVVNIIVNYCCTRELLNTKVLKETETEETKLFCHIFMIWWHFDWRGSAPWAPPGYAYAMMSSQNDIIFQKCGCDITIMTSSTQNQFFYKNLVNPNPHAKFGVSMTFGLAVR